MIETKEDILICECNSDEHQIIIRDFDDGDIYLTIHLTNNDNFFKRFCRGVKYIFGYKCKYGAWDEFVLSKKHIPKLKNLIEKLEHNG